MRGYNEKKRGGMEGCWEERRTERRQQLEERGIEKRKRGVEERRLQTQEREQGDKEEAEKARGEGRGG